MHENEWVDTLVYIINLKIEQTHKRLPRMFMKGEHFFDKGKLQICGILALDSVGVWLRGKRTRREGHEIFLFLWM